MSRVDAGQWNPGWKCVLPKQSDQCRTGEHLQWTSTDQATGHQADADGCRGGPVVWASKGDEALCALVAPEVLNVVPGDDSAFGVTHDVEAFQSGSGADTLQLVCNRGCEVRNGASVEAPEQATQIEAEHAIAVIAEAILHHFPDVSSLEETMEQKDRLIELCKVVSSYDAVPAKVDPTDAPELIPEQTREWQRCHERVVHGVFVSGWGAA